jgi:phytol kinase
VFNQIFFATKLWLASESWFSSLANPWVQSAMVGFWLAAVVLTAEGLHRYQVINSENARKLVHIGSGNVILLAWWLGIPAVVTIAAAILAGIVALLSYKFPFLPGINSVGRKSLGTFFYAISIGSLVAWFWPLEQPWQAALGILIMAWGDGLAALIGQKFGKHPYTIWGIQKSWEGSLTMFVASFAVSCLVLFFGLGYFWQIWLISLAVALFATILEFFSKLGIDNLTVPLGSAALSFWLTTTILG